ncbi:MAG: adenine deaminase [Bacteroidales bacterium]|nr:adenine deaminase [Bacteroidales bacterium]
METLEGKIVDVVSKTIFDGRISIENGKITKVEHCKVKSQKYIMPGFVDSYTMFETSMLSPQQYAASVLQYGVVSLLLYPKGCCSVLGEKGFEYVMREFDKTPLKCKYFAPGELLENIFDCDYFDLDPDKVLKLFKNKNFYGCVRTNFYEANYNSIAFIDKDDYENVQLSSLLCRADEYGKRNLKSAFFLFLDDEVDFFEVLETCTIKPITEFALDVGLLQEGDSADLILVDDLKSLNNESVYISGNKVFDNGKPCYQVGQSEIINKFHCKNFSVSDLFIPAKSSKINVIQISNKPLETKQISAKPLVQNSNVISDTKHDILKVLYINRTQNEEIVKAFVNGFNLKFGAIACCTSWYKQNILCVGADDESMVKAINTIVRNRGGLAVCTGTNVFDLKLPIGGFLTDVSREIFEESYNKLLMICKTLGCKLKDPLTILSSLTSLLLPEIRITEDGVYNFEEDEYVTLFA